MRETPDRILEAAERSMNRFGLAVSMSDVAADAGLSRGSLYRYFGDRDGLVRAVLDRTADRFVAAATERMARRRTLSGEFAEVARFVADTSRRVAPRGARRDTPLALVVVRNSSWLAERWMVLWAGRLDEAVDRGEVRADIDRHAAAEWLTRVLLSFAVAPQVAVDPHDHRALRRFVDRGLLRGLAA